MTSIIIYKYIYKDYKLSFYALKSIRDAAMNNIPKRNEYVTCLGLDVYLSPVGNSSSIEITVIIPATIPNRMPLATPEIPSFKMSQTTKAPTGSVSPDNVPHANE